MSKIIKFDETPEYKLEKAEEYYQLEDFDVALPLLFDALKQKPTDAEIKLFIARIYAEMSQLDFSTEMCISVLADGYNEDAVKGIISNLVCQGNFKDARFYTENFKVDFDFSDFLTVQTDTGDVLYGGDEEEKEYDEAAEKRKQFNVIVYKNSKEGKNLVADKSLKDMTVDDIRGLTCGQELFSFGELMEKLLSFDSPQDVSIANTSRRTELGFRQVYPVPKKDCEDIITKAYNLFSGGKTEDALKLLGKITVDCGKYYYIACKNKVMCYLSMNRITSMKFAAEEALKGLPDDFSLKCYHYMALKLLEENAEAAALLEEIINLKPASTIEYMVKMDVCRLAMYHKGVIECVEKILDELPYQPQFLLLRGKAEYNDGQIKVARATFLEVLRLYPDNFEARTLIRKIDSDDGGMMTYGDIEMAIKRVKLFSEFNLLTGDGNALYNYLKYNKDAYRNLEFLLLSESDKNVYSVASVLRHFMSGKVKRLFEKLLLKINASDYLKSVLISYYLYSAYPKRLAVTVGRRLHLIDMPQMAWEKGLNETAVLAADMAISDFVMNDPLPKKNITSLTSRLMRVSEYIMSETSDRETVRNFLDINDGVALKKAFCDITRNTVKRTPALTVQDEKYFECIELLVRIEEQYEI